MTFEYLLNGIMIGLIFGMPIGAVGAMSIQRTIHHGPLTGFISGAASSVADVLYACIGVFGLTVISDFLLEYQTSINLIGSLLIIVIAIQMMRKKDQKIMFKEMDVKENTKMFLSSFAIAITNPAAIISFLFAFSMFGINGTLDFVHGLQLVTGVFFGTLGWWLLLVIIVNRMKRKLNAQWFHRLNMIFGLILIIFGCCITIQTL